MKVAAYARYSSENQREESIEAQLAAIEEFCRKEGHIIVATYIDRAMSATTDNRPEFLRMIDDAKKGIFEAVIVHKLDRFARNRYDSAIYKRELKKAGVVLLSVTERLDDSPESIILESVLEGMAEYYSKNLAREVMKGLIENAKEAKFNGGIPPLGYDIDPATKKYVLNEKEAKIVRYIFDLYLRDYSYSQIIEELKKKGYKTKRGRNFTKNSLHDLLRNPIYAGYYVYGKGSKKKHRYVQNEQKIVIPNAVPAIITQAEYEKVKEKMRQNARGPGQYKAIHEYIFSGLLKCGYCGDNMIGMRSKNSLYYVCGKRKRSHDCKGTTISQKLLEKVVFQKITEDIFSPDKIDRIADKVYSILSESMKEHSTRKEEIIEQIRKLEKERQNIINAIAAGFSLAGLKEKAEEIETSIRYYNDALNRLNEPIPVSKEEVKEFLIMRREKLLNADDKKRIAREYIEKIIVDDENIEVHFTMPFLENHTQKFVFCRVTL